MRYFVDCLYPPDLEAARTIRDLGWSGLNVYIGGPRAASRAHWQNQPDGSSVVGYMAEIFDWFMPTYVGRNEPWDGVDAFHRASGQDDARDALNCAILCGFPAPQPIALDVEYGTWQAHPDATRDYILGFVEVCNEDGRAAGVYSDLEALGGLELGADVDFKWGAYWVPRVSVHRAPVGRFDPESPPPWQCWQFGQATIAGIQLDLNSAADYFMGAAYSAS